MTAGGPQVSDAQRLDWLRLIRTPRVGPALFQDLLDLYGTAANALEALPEIGRRRGIAFRPADQGDIEREMDEARRIGARFVIPGEAGYPRTLTHGARPPPVLCALIQDTAVCERPAIAMVGARNASAGGLTLARRIAAELGQAGFVTVSGMARGIDAASHLGSLETGTLAFLAGGLARPYPPEHAHLMSRIVDNGGAVYSEMPLEWVARAQDFPRRNRLVAGSSQCLVVIEAARRSGSLITARQAGELGRLVMAVPGFPLDPRSEGPNSLIRQGATLVTCAQEVIEEISPTLDKPLDWAMPDASDQTGKTSLLREGEVSPSGFANPDSTSERALEEAMGYSPLSADDLIAATGIPTPVVRVWLVENELAGRVVRSAGDRFAWSVTRPAP